MPNALRPLIFYGWLSVTVLSSTGCEPKRSASMTVSEMMEDRVTLDGVLLKCNENPAKAHNDSNCLNARVAIERLANDVDPTQEAKRQADFERSREERRLAQERLRQEQEAKSKIDGYDLPVVPVEPARPAPGRQ